MPAPPDLIIDGFAGFGWAEALRARGLREIGLELDRDVCLTRRGAGHTTIRCDITQYPTRPFAGRAKGGIFSPVCPPFGKSGKKLGLADLPLVHAAIDDLANGRDTRARHGARCLDERSILTAEPMRWLHDLRPEWVLMEQVPSVLPVWDHYAEVLRTWGYSVATGVVDAAAYGLPSHRPRAVLAASRIRDVALPVPTRGPGLLPYVPMASAIGWGYTGRPAPTVTGGGTRTGGAEPFGNGSRQAMRRAMGTPAWADRDLPHLRPTIPEACTLNGIRPGLRLHGRTGARYLQAGNVVPPPLAARLVEAVIGSAGLELPRQLALDLIAA